MSDKQNYCKIKLSQDDRTRLDIFLLMTTKYRQEEMKAWEELSKEKNEDGTPVYKNAEGNARWWRELCDAIPRIKDAINNYEHVNEQNLEINAKEDIDICE